MNPSIRLCLVLHNHQPIGNFENVIQQAYEDSYLPFLDVFERYEHLNISLHTSGPLMEWFDKVHPEYLDRIAKLVQAGRVEIVGGAFYEPILTMIPSRDRVGQIATYTRWLEDRLQAKVQGMWIPERVWEQSLTRDIARAGIEYCVLDDYHFRKAGVTADQLHSYHVTEDQGRTLKVFPGSEQLRYLIPFSDASQTVDHLRELANQRPGSLAVFGDDGEKFGTWPDTKQHVYEEGWLEEFFTALTENRDWLNTCTLTEAASQVAPAGQIYLPDCSYREMTEWALPVPQQVKLDEISHSFQDDPRWENLRQFIHGGFWRNFKVKYPETQDMYARMIGISERLETARADELDAEQLDLVQDDLYRGQCNCSYWHGAFGGVYLPHLRNAVFQHLIAAENSLNTLRDQTGPRVTSEVADFNFDGRNEVRLENESLVAFVSPAMGGQLYELDIRRICHNLLATISRRPEAYHEKVRHGANPGSEGATSIHDRVVFKQEGLEDLLQYDQLRRSSLIDHFYDNDATLAQVAAGDAMERGDFATGHYTAMVQKNPDRIRVQMQRSGNAWGIPLKITKGVTLAAGESSVEIAYLIEGLPQDRDLHFGIELNLAGLPSGADDRFFHRDGQQLGHLGTRQDLNNVTNLNLTDQWLNLDAGFSANRPTGYWAYPVETVSQSESGFESVHQAVCVQPHWLVRGDDQGCWTVTVNLQLNAANSDTTDQQRQQSLSETTIG